MANTKGLKKGNPETQYGSSGRDAVADAYKSHDARRRNTAEKKVIRECILERMGETDWNEMIDGVIARAKESDKGFEILRDTIGQKPTERVEVSGKSEKLDDIITQLGGEELEE